MTIKHYPQLLSDKPLGYYPRPRCECCLKPAQVSSLKFDPEDGSTYVRDWCYNHDSWWKRVIFNLRQSKGTPHALTISTLAFFGLLIFIHPAIFLLVLLANLALLLLIFLGWWIYSNIWNFFDDIL